MDGSTRADGMLECTDPFRIAGKDVLFMDDFTRSPANGLVRHAANRAWTRQLFRPALAALGCPQHDWQHDADLAAVQTFMTALGLPASPAGWAATSALHALPAAASTWLDDRIATSGQEPGLVIGFELPVFLLHHLANRAIPFLDISIDPARFARDLFFRVRTNHPAILQRLQRVEVPDDVLRVDAALLAAHAVRHHPPLVQDPAETLTVFFAQTLVDRALIEDGRFVDPRDYIARIAAAAQATSTLLVSPHPFEPRHGITAELVATVPNARITNANAYAMLASDQVQQVVSLSSSLMTEARFFAKPALSLVSPDVDDPAHLPASCSRWYRLGTTLIDPAFWTGRAKAHAVQPNVLRESLGLSWARTLPLAARQDPRPLEQPRWRKVAHATKTLILALMV